MREWLKDARTKAGFTMRDVGEKLGISESYYCAIEKGERQKKMDMMVASGLSMILGIPISEIVRMEQMRKKG